MKRVLVPVLATLVLIIVGAVATLGIAYWVMARRFVTGDAGALDGIVRTRLNEPSVFLNVTIWDGRGGPVQRNRSLVVREAVPMIIGGFGLGICAGAIVLSRIAQRTSGSVLAAALWHALYNMTSATAASRGVIASVATMCVMVWATVLLVEEARRRTRRSGLLVEQV